MNRILILEIEHWPEMQLNEMNTIFRKYIEESWKAKLKFTGNYPDQEAFQFCNLINKKQDV